MKVCSCHNRCQSEGELVESEFVEGWKRITNDPYVLIRFTSPPLLRETPWEIRSSQGPEKVQGIQEQKSLMTQKNVITDRGASEFPSNVFLVRKSSVGYSLNAHIFAPLGLNTAPQVFTHLGHTVTGYLHRLRISVIPYLDDWLVHHSDPPVLVYHQSQLLNTLDLVVQYIQFLGVQLCLNLLRAFLQESKAREIAECMCEISFRVSQFMGSLNWVVCFDHYSVTFIPLV